jgi:hypothetical protein
MSFWAPTIGEMLYVIALFLFGAILLAPLAGWAPTDDTNHRDENEATGSEPQAEKGNS